MVFQRQRRTPRRRRRLKREVYAIPIMVFSLVYQYNEMRFLTTSVPGLTQQVVLKDSKGRIVSRNSTSLSLFAGHFQDEPTHPNMTLVEAKIGREPILSIFEDAGIVEMSPSDVLKLPKWSQVEELYGKGPVILGLEGCEAFRKRVPPEKRFIGVSGIFNSGTTAFGISLQANCRYVDHGTNLSNDVVTDVDGMLNQVPWAKHKLARLKYNHTIHPDIDKDNVLPIVLVRDPYFWMHSMCKQGYGVRWDHNSDKHCPNLVPDEYDRKRFKRLRNASSVRIWMGASPKAGSSWDSLAHYWNDWYESYLAADFPRLLIRFEDTLFHGKEVMNQVCECGGAQLSSQFNYLVDEAKWNHKHAQNNMVSAIVKYGTQTRRYRNMTSEDLTFAHSNLDGELMRTFHYKSYENPH
jgi:hypothetical protein